ncbi:hypothetical protein EJB05_54079, partial [Eragrostis curvula]
MVDCRGGFVLLGDCTAESYAVLNPSTRKGTQDSGLFIYWPFKSRKSFIMLDTSTMELSVAQLPLHLKNRDHIHSFVIGDTEDGLPCIVYAAKFNIGVLLRNADDGYERWVLDRLHSLKEQVGRVLGALPDYISGLNKWLRILENSGIA